MVLDQHEARGAKASGKDHATKAFLDLFVATQMESADGKLLDLCITSEFSCPIDDGGHLHVPVRETWRIVANRADHDLATEDGALLVGPGNVLVFLNDTLAGVMHFLLDAGRPQWQFASSGTMDRVRLAIRKHLNEEGA